MNTKPSKPQPSLKSFHQNPKTTDVCSMICETGANQLVVRCSDCNKIHDPQITRDAIIENPLIPLQPYLTSPRLVSEVCVKGLFYELALAEKQLSAARVIFEGFNPGWIKKLATGQEGYLGDDLQQWHDELKTALTPKQSKITPGQIPLWTTTTTNDDTENNNNSISPKKEKETAADAKT